MAQRRRRRSSHHLRSRLQARSGSVSSIASEDVRVWHGWQGAASAPTRCMQAHAKCSAGPHECSATFRLAMAAFPFLALACELLQQHGYAQHSAVEPATGLCHHAVCMRAAAVAAARWAVAMVRLTSMTMTSAYWCATHSQWRVRAQLPVLLPDAHLTDQTIPTRHTRHMLPAA